MSIKRVTIPQFALDLLSAPNSMKKITPRTASTRRRKRPVLRETALARWLHLGNARERRLANEFAQRLDDSGPEVVGLR